MRRVRREDRWLDRQMGIPEDLPAKEREAIREQARYETFRQGSAMRRSVLFGVAIVVTMFVCASGVLFALLWLTPLGQAGPVARALVAGAVIGCVVVPGNLLSARYRARLMRPKARELLAARHAGPG